MAQQYTFVVEKQEVDNDNDNIEVIRVIDASSPLLKHLLCDQLYHVNYEYVEDVTESFKNVKSLSRQHRRLTRLQLQALRAINNAYDTMVKDVLSVPTDQAIMFTPERLLIDSTEYGVSCLDVINDKTDEELQAICDDLSL